MKLLAHFFVWIICEGKGDHVNLHQETFYLVEHLEDDTIILQK